MSNTIEREWRDLGVAVGAIAAILVAGALVGLRSVLDNTSVALILVLVIVGVAAIGGRAAGVVTALSAGIAFDFFHTEPYGRMTIDSAHDVETLVLLVAVGLVAGEIVVRARGVERREATRHNELERVHRVAQVAAERPTELVDTVALELVDELGLESCRFEPGPSQAIRPELGSRGTISRTHYRLSGGEFELPAGEVALPVRTGDRELGRFVLVPTPGVGVAKDRRLGAVTLAALVAVNFEPHPPSGA